MLLTRPRRPPRDLPYARNPTRAARGAVLVAVIGLTSGCIGGNVRMDVGEDGSVTTSYGKVEICHDDQTLLVPRSQLTVHMQHGDRRGACR